MTAGAGCAATGTHVAEDPPPPELPPPLPESSELAPRALPDASTDASAAPFELTASDGTGLRLVSLKARAVVAEPLAFTELHLVFDNPEDRTIEGQFTIDLPTGTAISRFAMKIGGHWQEGEVVERQAARVAYEDFLHRKQDPALLENQAGNRFSARVFPIPARGRKELVISYSQALPDSRAPYQLMLAGLPRLEELDVQILVDQAQELSGTATSLGGTTSTRKVITVRERDYMPAHDLDVRSARASQALGLRHGGLAVARVQATGSMPADPIDGLTILFDTSASRALDFGGQVRRLGALVEQLRKNGDFPLRVLAFDQDVSVVFNGTSNGFGAQALDVLYTRRALGASDLEGALRRVGPIAKGSRVLLLTDGIATAGESEAIALGDAARALGEQGVQRLDAIIDGGLQDRATLVALTTAGLERDGIVVDARLDPSEIAAKLGRATLADLTVSVPDATFVWPQTLRGVQPGDEVLVYAELPADAGMTVVLEGTERSETDVLLVAAEQPLLARALAGARIDALTHGHSMLAEDATEPRKRMQEQIVALSTKHRVLSDFTALLVLETEADYQRFAIDRKALADVLTVGVRGVEVMQRGPTTLASSDFDPELAARQQGLLGVARQEEGHFLASPYGGAFSVGNDDQDMWGGLTGTDAEEAYGIGGLGLVGTGRGGGGTGSSTISHGFEGRMGSAGGGGSGERRSARRSALVRQGRVVVRGDLDKDVIRRIVRAHINEVRWCYDLGLTRDSGLRGRVAVQFSIGPTGRVPVAVVAENSVADADVGTCIARAVKRWRFPSPGAGSVIVTYPFILGSGESEGTETPSQTEAEAAAAAVEAERIAEERRRLVAEAERIASNPYDGKMLEVMTLVEAGSFAAALRAAQVWHDESPGDVLALVAMGEALEAQGKTRTAARVYGSLIDLFPSRADMRRYAGYRLDRLPGDGRRLAADTYRHAAEQRPDHPNSHRLHAWALVRDGRLDEGLDAILAGAGRKYPDGRFAGVDRILREDAGLIAAAAIAAEPALAGAIRARLAKVGASIPKRASTRFVMSWETDANDVDFHVHDGKAGHASYSAPQLQSGGSLYADVTTGYGPECFTIEGSPTAFPYRFEANFYARGPMGYGMGTLQIVQHDGKGGLVFDDRPFIIMKDGAFVQLGGLTAPLGSAVTTGGVEAIE